MSLFEGLAANEGEMGGGGGRQDCRDCGVTGQVIPTAPVAIPESPFAPPKLPGGAPIVIVRPREVLPPSMLPPLPMTPSPINVQPPFVPQPMVEPRPLVSPQQLMIPRVTNGDVFPHSPMVAPLGARSRLGRCIDLSALGPGGRPALTSRDPSTALVPFDAVTHHPHEPFLDAVTVRRCPRAHVLSWQGLCVSKKEIKNSDRMYPKPPRPLGTRSELKAVRVASSFGKRLKKNEKRLAKLGRALGASSRGRY